MICEPSEVIQNQISLVIRRLNELDEGAFVSYQDLANAAGVPTLSGSSYVLQQARHILQREELKVFLCIRGKGVKYAIPAEVVKSTEQARAKINRGAMRGLRRNNCARIPALTESERLTHAVHNSLLAAAYDVTTTIVRRRLAVHMAKSQEVLSRNATLAFLMQARPETEQTGRNI